MHEQQPRIEDRPTRGDIVAATIAGTVCIGLLVLALTFTGLKDRTSVSSLPMESSSTLLAP
jgi:hypothetical protein